MRKDMPTKPGRYVEFCNRDGKLRYAPMTQAMHDRRNAIAKALGFTLPERCSISRVHGDSGRRHDCWERGEHEYKGVKVASEHHIFTSDLSRYGAPHGAVGYWWPEDVEKAAYAIDKRKPMPDDPADAEPAEKPAPATQGQLF